MPRLRLSIAQIMIFVLFLGVVFGILRSPSSLIASATWTLIAALLCWSVVASILQCDRRQAFWLGFAVFGWVHLVLIFRLYRPDLSSQQFLPLPPLLLAYAFEDIPVHIVAKSMNFRNPGGLSGIMVAGSYHPNSDFPQLEFGQIVRLLTVLIAAVTGGGLSRLAVGSPGPAVPPTPNDASQPASISAHDQPIHPPGP